MFFICTHIQPRKKKELRLIFFFFLKDKSKTQKLSDDVQTLKHKSREEPNMLIVRAIIVL